MSGLALVAAPLQSAPSQADLEQLLVAQAHRGSKVGWRAAAGSLIGCVNLWETPEDVGEALPIQSADGRVVVAWDGRIDNRQDLIRSLDLSPSSSDAVILLSGYLRWNEGVFGRILGPFAVIVVDSEPGKIILARDPVGRRSLFYRHIGHTLLAASETQALVAQSTPPPALNELSIARYFASMHPEPGQTFFSSIDEVRPGHTVTWTDGLAHRSFWSPPDRLRLGSDREYVECFRDLLSEAVQCRTRSLTPWAVLMSGGLDSASVAAAGMTTNPPPATAISFVFGEVPEADESGHIAVATDHLGLPSVLVDAPAWRPRGRATSVLDPGQPLAFPYTELMVAVYSSASRARTPLVLTGSGADSLYIGAEEWLADLLIEKRWREAASDLRFQVDKSGIVHTIKSRTLKAVVRRGLPWLPNRRQSTRPALLQPRAARLVADSMHAIGRTTRWRPWQTAAATSGHTIDQTLAERLRAATGTTGRHPYTDRRLVEFFLSIPAHQLFRRGVWKPIARTGMADRLPVSIVARPKDTSLAYYFAKGALGAARGEFESHLRATEPLWAQYLEPAGLWQGWTDVVHGGVPYFAMERVLGIMWRALCFGQWIQGPRGPKT